MIGIHSIFGKEVPYLKTNERGEELLKIELQERIEKINRNVDKIGSINALKNISPASKKYVINTYNYLRFYYFTGEVETRYLDDSTLEKAVVVLNNYASIDKLDDLILSGWDNVMTKFNEAKDSLQKELTA